MKWKKYRRKYLCEMRPYISGENTEHINILDSDKEKGSPKLGDMIARNPKNYNDQWLVAEQHFKNNLEPA